MNKRYEECIRFESKVKFLRTLLLAVNKVQSCLTRTGGSFCAGIDFKIKTINVQDQRVKLQVWDTAGQERFRTITQTYYKGAMGIILVYDCTEETTFNNISNWLKQNETHASQGVAKVLVANKTDLPNRVIPTERGQALAEEYGLKFFETSAKTGSNINEMFFEVAD